MTEPLRPWPWWLKVFWLFVGVAVIGLWSLVLMQRMQARPGALHDFVQEWTSVRNHHEGEPIYSDLRETIPRYLGQPYDDVVHVNAHPPTAVLITLPFGGMPYPQAFFRWNALSMLALVVAVVLLVRELGYSYWSLLPIGALLATSNSLAQQVNQGQLNLLLLVLCVCAWLAWRRGAEQTAGVLVGVMAAIKIFPGFLVVVFLAQRKWNAVAGAVIGFVIMIALTGAVLGFDVFREYVFEAAPQVTVFRDYWPNASIVGFWSKLVDPQSGHVETFIQSPWLGRGLCVVSLLAVAGAVAWRASRCESRADEDLVWALAFAAMLLCSPITWDHYFLLLTPVLLIQWPRLDWRGKMLLVALAIGLLTIYPKWIWDAFIPGDGELANQPGQTRSVGTPLEAATLLSYQFYLLLGWFAFSLVFAGRRSVAASDDVDSAHSVAEDSASELYSESGSDVEGVGVDEREVTA